MFTRYLALFLLCPLFLAAQTGLSDTFSLVIAPGLTPVAAMGFTEIGLYNSFETYRSDDTLDYRGAELTHFLQIQHGFSRQNRFSAGADVLFGHLRYGPSSEVGSFGALGDAPVNGVGAHSLSAVGARVRYVPFVRHYEFILQSSVYFPVAARENRLLLGEDRIRFSVEGNYSTLFAPGWYVVAQVAPQVRFENTDRKQTTWELPANVYVIRRISPVGAPQQFYLFGSAGYFSSFEQQYKGGLRQVNWTLSAGLGAQWVLNTRWSFSLGWQALPAFDDSYSIRKGSYANVSIGARYVGKL